MQRRLAVFAVVSVVLATVAGAYVIDPSEPEEGPSGPTEDPAPNASLSTEPTTMTTFDSEADFSEYVLAGQRSHRGGHLAGGRQVESSDGGDRDASTPMATEVAADSSATSAPSAQAGGAGGGAPSRHSGTNVQVEGVSEPDIVKTDGQFIYHSSRERYGRHVDDRHTEKGSGSLGSTQVIDARPPGTADLAAEIDHSGRLFLAGDRLVVVGEKVWGYDVADPEEPRLVWTRNVSASVRDARLTDGTVYLVLATPVDVFDPCPGPVVDGVTVDCREVHHPDRPVPVDVTYTAMTLDPLTGTVGDELSFVGGRDATVFMSKNGLYTTYTERTSPGEVRLEFLLTEARPLLDERVGTRLERVRSYDLSPRAERVEVEQVMRSWLATLDEERRRDVQRELRDGFRSYVEANKRKFTTTHVVRVDTGNGLSMAATGAVPGRPLNQFSLDEHEGHLRIATTVGERLGTESVNDVYVLDAAELSVTGSVTGMGETERIYAVRFVGDRGYVVTFRRIDPFHVLDLSDPTDPTEKGELELPGYSSYLHPLGDDRVLGIGEERGEVKAVVFDVSDPTDPTIEESRVLSADWSAIARTHHAFLRDERHGVFFLPTERGGYVLSTETLETVHRVDVRDPRRALYIDDYLYVFGEGEVAVVNESTWEREDTLDL